MKIRWLLLLAVLVPFLAVATIEAQIRPGGGSGGVTGWPSVATTKVVTWANSFANALGIGDGTDYWAIYRDSVNGLQINPVCGGVENGCNQIKKLGAGYYWEIQSATGTSLLRVTNDTGVLTNISINTETAGNTITMQEEDWWEVAACQASTAQIIWNTPAANAPAAACDPDSTPNAYASFDATTDESIDRDMVLPIGFTGAIDVGFIWKAAATSGNVGWCAQLVRVPDGTTSGQTVAAQSSSNCVSDAAKGTTLQENYATITGVTCTSCAAHDRVKLRVSRDANGGAVTDDMTGDAHLLTVGRTWRVQK